MILFGVDLETLLIAGCSTSSVKSADEMGFRNTNLLTEDTTVADTTNYSKAVAGTSKVIERAYENAPPMIPHDVEGMMDINRNQNACLDCHAPGVAEALNAKPAPLSHYASFRPVTSIKGDKLIKDGKPVVNTSDIKSVTHTRADISGERYTCTACHAPQSDNKIIIDNNFKADFRRDDMGLNSSNLIDNIHEGVK